MQYINMLMLKKADEDPRTRVEACQIFLRSSNHNYGCILTKFSKFPVGKQEKYDPTILHGTCMQQYEAAVIRNMKANEYDKGNADLECTKDTLTWSHLISFFHPHIGQFPQIKLRIFSFVSWMCRPDRAVAVGKRLVYADCHNIAVIIVQKQREERRHGLFEKAK